MGPCVVIRPRHFRNMWYLAVWMRGSYSIQYLTPCDYFIVVLCTKYHVLHSVSAIRSLPTHWPSPTGPRFWTLIRSSNQTIEANKPCNLHSYPRLAALDPVGGRKAGETAHGILQIPGVLLSPRNEVFVGNFAYRDSIPWCVEEDESKNTTFHG